MRKDAIYIEEGRVSRVRKIEEYQSVHERHRIFPTVLQEGKHERILDIAAGIGLVGKRIKDNYAAQIYCNDISPTCIDIIKRNGLKAISFDVDTKEYGFPFKDECLDTIIALATIEHVIHVDNLVNEIYRVLSPNGYFYVSAPNYSGLLYLAPFLVSGKTFHDPLFEKSKYEFYAHVRYFTYRSLLDYITSFGLTPDTVYLPKPKESSRFQNIMRQSKLKAFAFRLVMIALYRFLGPRWASEPVICFRKFMGGRIKIRKKII